MLDWLTGPDGIGGLIVKGLRSLCYWLDELIYELIPNMYNLFDRLCTARMLDGEVMRTIADRIGLLLGIIMFFYVIFNLIQTLLNPDLLNDKEKGITNIVKKVILVIVMLGVSNFVFDALYGIQKTILKSDVISKLILPYTVENREHFGNFMTGKLMESFYEIRPEEDFTFSNDDDREKYYECKEIYDLLQFNISNYADLELGHICLNETLTSNGSSGIEETSIFMIKFDEIISVIVGIFILYFLFSYCLSVGVRMLQLMFLEIISPMAIISYLSLKKDNIFTKWWKIYVSTYIDVFIRIAIISFALFLIATIFNSSISGDFIFWSSMEVDPSSSEAIFLEIILILAILTFAKKVPDLINELIPKPASKISKGITSPKKTFDNMLGGNLVQGATKAATVGTAIGLTNAVTSGVSRYRINTKNGKDTGQALLGAVGGVLTGFGRGVVAGSKKGNAFGNFSKGIKDQRGVDDKYDELITSGGSTVGKTIASISSHFGETKGQEYTRRIKNNEAVTKAYDAINNAAEGFKQVKIAKTIWENAKARGASDADIQAAYDNYKATKKTSITTALSGGTFAEAEDQAIAAGIDVHKADLDNLVKTQQVNVGVTSFTNYDAINDASVNASRIIADIKREPDYSKAIANDKAAGVNSNGSGKK